MTIMQPLSNRTALYDALNEGATLITPNNRLSNQLLRDYFKERTTHDQTTAILKPHCQPYHAFLQTQYHKARHSYAHHAHPQLLTTQQQRQLWRQILMTEHEPPNEGLLTQVQEAWIRCQDWHISPHHVAFSETPQTQQFQSWQHQFQQRLDDLDAITEHQLARHLLTYPELFNDMTLVWVCFDDFTPDQSHLQQQLKERHCTQYLYDLSPQHTSVHRYEASDRDDEYAALIQWIHHQLGQSVTRIGVVIPDLQTESHALQRRLEQHLSPDVFNLSLGQPLIQAAIVSHSLRFLSLQHDAPITHHDIHLLLHSPYLIASETEFKARTDLLQDPRVHQTTMTPNAFIDVLESTAPQLAFQLKTLPSPPKQATPADWIAHFKGRLIHLGFPGEYPLNSVNYQYFQRLMMLFDDYLLCTITLPMMTEKEAIEGLVDLATTTIFQTQTTTTPVQILGLLEASGCTFDSIWITGLTDQCLPQKVRLSAFIPITLQRTHAMPHATPERELTLAKQILDRFNYGCRELIVSYPKLIKDIPQLPSPLITHYPMRVETIPPISKSTPELVPFDEMYQLPILPNEPITGGTALLTNQAKCPFRAFATHRLYAKPVPQVSDGPDASERGQLIHQMMEKLWRRWKNQDHLLSLSKETIHEDIQTAILDTLTPFYHEKHPSIAPLIKHVEFNRLHRLIHACVAWEKQRPSFVVDAVEQAFTITLGGIDFKVRVDRLDAIASDKKWVIDYKSTLPTVKPWHEERPETPQLLLYALLDDAINGLLLVQLKAGRVTCQGLSEEQTGIPGVQTLKQGSSWSDYQTQWRNQLSQLAQEFQQGHSIPEPNHVSTCLYCDFPSLCRK